MKKSLLFLVVFILNANVFPQSSQNLNVSFGLLSPLSGIQGFTTSVGFEKQLSATLSIYCYAGNIYWNHDNFLYGNNLSDYTNYTDDNNIYSFYGGTRFLLSTIRTFRIYTDLELGYNYMTYNAYNLIEFTDPLTHQKSYLTDIKSRDKITENLLGFGVGLGVSHQLTEKAGFYLEIKRNQLFNNIDLSLTRYSLNCGIFYNI